MVLQLSDPSEYDGGDLELFIAPNPTVATRKKGLIYIFPSWVLHRVTPVTRGIRKSLVIWITGPKFK
jgi:PKHD-type hydroxylase